MIGNKGFFRTAFDALVESRTREAQRQVSLYRNRIDFDTTIKGKR